MIKYQDVVLDPQGNVVSGASVTVYNTGTTVKPTIYSDEGVTVAANPLTSSATGSFSFYVADGDYDIVITKAGFTTVTHTDTTIGVKASTVSLVDAAGKYTGTNVETALTELKTTAELAASTGAALIGNAPAGNIVGATVQAAINELDTEKASLAQLAATGGAALVGVADAGSKFTGTTVETALQEARTSAELSASTGAALVGFAPTGTVAAATVQAAIAELDTEKAALADLASTASGKGADLVANAVRRFATIALMSAMPASSIAVSAITTDVDGQGGNFYYVPGSVQTVDNGLVFTANGGRWFRNGWTVLGFNGSVNARWFGAKGDGSNATTAIQAALTASLDVFVPQGNYLLSATLIMRTAGRLIGAGAEKTIFQRNSNYGDTLQVGDVTAGHTFNANDFVVKDIWFYRPITYVAGTTTTIDNPVAASAAAINVYGGQRGLIDGCFFSAMPYNIIMEQSSLCTISRNTFNGLWDPSIAGLQEGIASIYLKSNGTTTNTLITIDNNHLSGGFFSASRSVTIGTATFNTTLQIGAKVGVLVNSAEGLNITNNYLGGQAEWSMKLHTNQITAGLKISDNFFDCGLEGGVQFETQTASHRVVGAQIHDNYFNGQLINKRAMDSQYPASLISVASLEIHDNVIENFTKTPVNLNGVDGGSIEANVITAYDARAGGVGDADFAAGVRIQSGCTLIRTGNNKYGGGTNGPSGANNCKWGVLFDAQASGYAKNEHALFLGAANPILVQNSGLDGQTATLTAAGNYTFVSPVSTLLIRKTVPASTQVTPPSTPFIGQIVTVEDADGVAAGAGPIQIVGTVDGAVNPVFATAFVTVMLVWNGTQWNRLG